MEWKIPSVEILNSGKEEILWNWLLLDVFHVGGLKEGHSLHPYLRFCQGFVFKNVDHSLIQPLILLVHYMLVLPGVRRCGFASIRVASPVLFTLMWYRTCQLQLSRLKQSSMHTLSLLCLDRGHRRATDTLTSAVWMLTTEPTWASHLSSSTQW